MPLRTLGPKAAALLDEELMSSGSFTLDQLMELAGLAVAQVLHTLHPITSFSKPSILIACGPGNNGGDGLVAARHLHYFGYRPSVYYPKPGRAEHYGRLRRQLEQLRVPFVGSEEGEFRAAAKEAEWIVDAVFGFSFKGTDVREPFGEAVKVMAEGGVKVLAVDAPSSWDIERGPPDAGPGRGYMPDALVSLTAPKPLVKWFKGRHFVGGRFVGEEIAKKYEFDIPPYAGADQIVEIGMNGEKL